MMKKLLGAAGAGFLAGVIIGPGLATAQEAAASKDASLEREIKTLSTEISDLSAAIDNLKTSVESSGSPGASRALYKRQDLAELGYELTCDVEGGASCNAAASQVCTDLGHGAVLKVSAKPRYLPDQDQPSGSVLMGVACR